MSNPGTVLINMNLDIFNTDKLCFDYFTYSSLYAILNQFRVCLGQHLSMIELKVFCRLFCQSFVSHFHQVTVLHRPFTCL